MTNQPGTSLPLLPGVGAIPCPHEEFPAARKKFPCAAKRIPCPGWVGNLP
jgi:hypothetical protein